MVGVLLLIEAAVLVCLLKEHKRAKAPMVLCMALVTVGLLFDGAVILLGRYLPEGLLKVLSMGRYLFHGLCMPLLLMISVYALGLKGTAVKIFWGVAALLMALGAVAGPRAEKANIKRPLRNRNGPFFLIMSQKPTRIRGITMATDRMER